MAEHGSFVAALGKAGRPAAHQRLRRLAGGTATAAIGLLRASWLALHAAIHWRQELLRVADACQAERPEQAARLRRAAAARWIE